MGRTYKCTKCGKDHERPVGENCQESHEEEEIPDSEVIGNMDSNATGGSATNTASTVQPSADITAVLASLKIITQRLDAIEGGGPTTQTTTATPGPLTAAGKTLDQLLQVNDSESNGQCSSSATVADRNCYDPRTVLTLRAKAAKAVHITQFLHEGTKKRRARSQRRDVVLESGEGLRDRLIVQADDQHPYANIGIAEWGAANCRLMHDLLKTCQLKHSDVEYYLAYTTKIFDMVDKFEWSSILDYDYQYRELQAEYEFNWGTAHSHLELQVLTPRDRRQTSTTPQMRQNPEDCKLYLAHGHCRFGENCRYRHPANSRDTNRVERMDQLGNRNHNISQNASHNPSHNASYNPSHNVGHNAGHNATNFRP